MTGKPTRKDQSQDDRIAELEERVAQAEQTLFALVPMLSLLKGEAFMGDGAVMHRTFFDPPRQPEPAPAAETGA